MGMYIDKAYSAKLSIDSTQITLPQSYGDRTQLPALASTKLKNIAQQAIDEAGAYCHGPYQLRLNADSLRYEVDCVEDTDVPFMVACFPFDFCSKDVAFEKALNYMRK